MEGQITGLYATGIGKDRERWCLRILFPEIVNEWFRQKTNTYSERKASMGSTLVARWAGM